jgi:phosphoribosylformylglycinamidine synthase subunit PurS
MRFIAEVEVMPHPELLDPQGKAVRLGLEHLGLDQVIDVRVGKHIRLVLEADTEAAAHEQVETACRQLLANPIMEGYTFRLAPAAEFLAARQ